MKKLYFVLAFASMTLVNACSEDSIDNEEEFMPMNPCDGTAYTYTDDVKSIVNASCALSGCHAEGGVQPAFTTYSGLKNLASSAVTRINGGNMPPPDSGITLTKEQKNIITCWVENGAPE